jgi:small basic protein
MIHLRYGGFLTRLPQAPRAHVALYPHTHVVSTWERTHRKPPGVTSSWLAIAVIAALSIYGVANGVLALVNDPLRPSYYLWFMVFLVVDAAALWAVWRQTKVGVYVNDLGLRVRHIYHTRIFQWTDIAGFETGQVEPHPHETIYLYAVLRQGPPWEIKQMMPVYTVTSGATHRDRSMTNSIYLDHREFHELRTLLARRLAHALPSASEPKPI